MQNGYVGGLIAIAMTMTIGPAIAEPRIDAVTQGLPQKAREAMDRIPEQDRKLLALRSYLRSVSVLEARWSWSEAEIDAYLKSDQYVSAMAAVAAVTKAFEVKNPGYSLYVNTDVRSLEEQLDKWNTNASVKAAAGSLDVATAKWLTDNPKAGPNDLRGFLTGWRPAATSLLAAPGLTRHGRGEAIDFQIFKDGAIIAGAGSGASVWNGDGWGRKLQEAVKLSMMPFEGPLQDPDEPWHYDYDPPERARLEVSIAGPQEPETAEAETAATSPRHEAELLALAAKAADPAALSARPPAGVTQKVDDLAVMPEMPPETAPVPTARPENLKQDAAKSAPKKVQKSTLRKKKKSARKSSTREKPAAPAIVRRIFGT